MSSAPKDERSELGRRIQSLLASGDTATALALVDELATQRDELATQRDELATQRDALAAKVAEQDSRIVWLRRMLFGRKSEKLSAEELGQLVLAYGGTEEEAKDADPSLPVPGVDTESEPEESPKGGQHGKRRHRGRTKLSDDLERIVTEVAVPDAERACTAARR